MSTILTLATRWRRHIGMFQISEVGSSGQQLQKHAHYTESLVPDLHKCSEVLGPLPVSATALQPSILILISVLTLYPLQP